MSARPAIRERLREGLLYPRMLRQWRVERDRLTPTAAASTGRVLVLAADSRDPVGSRGDDAMIEAVRDTCRERFAGCTIDVATQSDDPAGSLAERDLGTVELWRLPWDLSRAWAGAREYDRLVVIGADVMDGYYSAITSLRLWLVADLFARAKGADRVSVTGFSFNAAPRWPVLDFLRRRATGSLVANLRDETSLGRFRAHGLRPTSRLVADCAFLLHAAGTEQTRPAAAWVEERHARGRVVVGVNVHPMLVRSGDPAELDQLLRSTAGALRSLVDELDCSILLIPHDFRGSAIGDVDFLDRLATMVDRSAEVLRPPGEHAAGAIKHLAGLCDAVVSGRMHLTIAALGSGVPAFGITYQDKFDGLFKGHFGLPDEVLLPAGQAQREDLLTRRLADFVKRRREWAGVVEEHLPAVSDLARLSLDGVAPAGPS